MQEDRGAFQCRGRLRRPLPFTHGGVTRPADSVQYVLPDLARAVILGFGAFSKFEYGEIGESN